MLCVLYVYDSQWLWSPQVCVDAVATEACSISYELTRQIVRYLKYLIERTVGSI